MSSITCPVSLVTGESKALVEMFSVQGRLGGSGPVWNLPARTVDALTLLEREMKLIKEGARGE